MTLKRYTANELRDLPTLATGQADNLKLEFTDPYHGEVRVWLSRCGVEDGMPYDDIITIENLAEGRWVQVDQYPGSGVTS